MAARGASVRALADSASLVAGGLLRSLIAMSQHLPSYVRCCCMLHVWAGQDGSQRAASACTSGGGSHPNADVL